MPCLAAGMGGPVSLLLFFSGMLSSAGHVGAGRGRRYAHGFLGERGDEGHRAVRTLLQVYIGERSRSLVTLSERTEKRRLFFVDDSGTALSGGLRAASARRSRWVEIAR